MPQNDMHWLVSFLHIAVHGIHSNTNPPIHCPTSVRTRNRSRLLPCKFRRTYIGIQRSIHSLANQCAFFLQIKVLEQHGHGKNLGQRIGDVLPPWLAAKNHG